MTNNICEVQNLGITPYKQAWDLQKQIAKEVAEGKRNPTLLLLEHPHTYTFGRRGNASNLLWGPEKLQAMGIEVHWVDRGGDVTYHGPGQLVGYPILPLGSIDTSQHSPRLPHADYIGFIRKLENVITKTLGKFNIPSKTIPGLTGVWVPQQDSAESRKIAAIGVKVTAQGISQHGFALNVDPDMSFWDGIIGCGLQDYHETSIGVYVDPIPTMDVIHDAFLDSLGTIFDFEMQIKKQSHKF